MEIYFQNQSCERPNKLSTYPARIEQQLGEITLFLFLTIISYEIIFQVQMYGKQPDFNVKIN